MKTRITNRLPKLLVFLAGVFSVSLFSVFVSAQVSIPLSFDNAVEYIKRLIVTDSGGNTGNVLLDIDGSDHTITINTGYIVDGSGWNNKALGLSGDGQLIYIDQSTSESTASGDYFPLAGNSITNPITGPLYMEDGNSNLTIGIETGTTMFNNIALLYTGPVITPMSDIQGIGLFPVIGIKGTPMIQGLPGGTTEIYFVNSTGDRGAGFSLDELGNRFDISLSSGGLDQKIAKWNFWEDGRIQAGDDISSIIDNDNDFITKKWVDDNFFSFAGNSISNPITGPLFIGDSTGSYNVEMGTTMLNFGTMLPVFGPIITSNAFVPGLGPILASITKGTSFFVGEEDDDSQIFLSSYDGTYTTRFSSHGDEPQFELMLASGDLTDDIAKWHFYPDGRLKANYDISSVISADEDFITKKYADDNFFPGTSENPTGNGMDFRFARSGGLMEGQYFTGGTWVTATVYNLP